MRTLIVLAGLLALLPLAAPAGGRPNARDEKLVVVDAHGKQVGTVVGSSATRVMIALGVNGRHVLLAVNWAVDTPFFPGTTLLVPPIQGAGLLRFESRDCSGQPFLLSSANELLDGGPIAPPGMTLYLPVPGAAPRQIAWSSYRHDTGGCMRQEEPVVSDGEVPAMAIVDLLTLFTPPFRVLIEGVRVPHAPKGVALVDANGKPVGTVVEARVRDATIALSVNGRRVLLDVISSVNTEYSPGVPTPLFRAPAFLAFESRDCSGPPFISEHPDRLFDWGAIAPPGLTLYLPAVPGDVPVAITAGSSASVAGCRTSEHPFLDRSYVPAVAVVDLLTLFTPPLRLRFVE